MGVFLKYSKYLDIAERSHNLAHYLNFQQPSRVFESSLMDVNAALKELGMLSVVPECRVRYLEEKKETKSIQSLASVCVVQMNTEFVTKLSLSKLKKKDAFGAVETEPEFKQCIERSMKMKKRNGLRFKPYSRTVEKKRKLMMEYDSNHINIVDDVIPIEDVVDCTISPVVSRQDSGNKSNPSSPVKSQGSLKTTSSSIVRSRSLDDLEKVVDSYACNGKSEIDTVSLCISRLHVS